MEYRRLGRTSEKVSAIGMGTWHFAAHATTEERQSEIAALRKGVELGINLIDTAEIYSSGRSEQAVGAAIHGLRESVFVATKVSADHLHYDDVLSACRGSLGRLGIDYIDLYQVHWPNPQIPIRETMRAMERLVSDGQIRYVGVSNFSASETEAAREALSKADLVSNQVEYSLSNRSVEDEVLPYCRKEGVTLIAYSPLDRGKLQAPVIPSALANKYPLTPMQFALNWVTRDEAVVAIPKSARVDHTEENAGSVAYRLSESEYDAIGAPT